MEELFRSIGLSYRLIYRLLHYASETRVVSIGACVIIGITVMGGGQFGNALPYALLWVLGCGTCRMLLVALPRPTGAIKSTVPREKPLPPSTIAVSIVQLCAPEACPPRNVMAEHLPDHLRGLLR